MGILKLSLRMKTLVSYGAIFFLMMSVCVISVSQFRSSVQKIDYLTDEIAEKVRLANEIESTILSMRTLVERFIYLNRDEDNILVEEEIKKV